MWPPHFKAKDYWPLLPLLPLFGVQVGVTKLASPLTLSTIDAYVKIGFPDRK